MASTNQSPQYQRAEAMFLRSQTNEDRLHWLEEMIRQCPKHKSAEKMLANLKTRYIKLKKKMESVKKTSKGAKKHGVRKEDLQAVIIGFTNSGKSMLLSALTNVRAEISPNLFTTKTPIVGMMRYSGTGIQLVEVPAIDSEHYDKGIVNTADSILLIVNDLDQMEKAEKILGRFKENLLVVFNIKSPEANTRKLESTLKSRKINYAVINARTGAGIPELKERIFKSFGKIRVYTKEPGESRSEKPFTFDPGATVKVLAEKIFGGADRIKETRIWGPSSKFPGQIVGLQHGLKDMDVVEFKTR